MNIARGGRTETYTAPAESLLPLMYDLMSGRLTPPEIVKQREEARKKADANGDGKLEGDERKAFFEAMMTIRFDADGNGTLNEAEQAKYDEAKKRFEQFRKQRENGEGRPEGRPGRPGRRPGGGGRPGGKGDKPKKPEKPDS